MDSCGITNWNGFMQISHLDANHSEEFHLHTLRCRARDGHVQLRSIHLHDSPITKSLLMHKLTHIAVRSGLFMAMQPKLIACGNSVAAITMAIRFLLGPAVMAATSAAVGLRGTLLCIAIVQVTVRR